MTTRVRTSVALALAALLALAVPATAPADQAYDKVAAAYAQSGGQLDPCAFTQRELEDAVRGIPREIRDVVPDIRRAMVEGIAAHMSGDCRDGRADATGGAAVPPAGETPTTTTPPPATTPAPADTTTDAAAAPPVDSGAAPPPAATTPGAETTPGQAAAATDDDTDLTPLLITLVAVGALLLLALLLWGWARMRGWDPAWGARMRHAWGEAGFRTTSTWSEFTDWLRLGR
jgi:hypothetical protein